MCMKRIDWEYVRDMVLVMMVCGATPVAFVIAGFNGGWRWFEWVGEQWWSYALAGVMVIWSILGENWWRLK